MWKGWGRKLATSAVALLPFATSIGCGSYRLRAEWELPRGYHGWVFVERSNPGCPAARLTPTAAVFSVDSTGRGCSSTPLPKNSPFITFWEVDSHGYKRELKLGSPGDGGQIWGFGDYQASSAGLPVREATVFFVGTEKEFASCQGPPPRWWLEHGADRTSPRDPSHFLPIPCS